jgi:hypothetical protein
MFERNYSSYTSRRSENLCSSSGDAQEKKKDRVKLRTPPPPPLECYCTFLQVFLNLTLCMTKLTVLVLSFPDFTDISNIMLDRKKKWRKRNIY